MRSFHILIQRHDWPERRSIEQVDVDGQTVSALRIEPGQLNWPLAVSFDEVLDRLSALPRMFTEPDGSFVWVGQDGVNSWQLDGQLHDGARGLMDVELKGSVPRPTWQQLIGCLGGPADRLVFQLVREGLFVDPTQFERLTWPEDSVV